MVLGPTQSLTKDSVKTRWGERYVSDSLNKKFLGLPRGVYLGFVPSPSGLVLTLKTDQAITLIGSTGVFSIGTTVTGGTSGATATIRVVTVGYLLIDNVVGGPFLAGETITAPGPASATVGSFTTEGLSIARVVTNTPLVPGRSDDMVDIVTGDNVVLDFTGFADATYFVIATGSYQVGQPTTAAVITRSAPPPNGVTEILLCEVTKTGASLSVAALAPTSRQEPFAFQGQRIGFMPGGAIENLLAAVSTTEELIASRLDTSGTTAPAFNNASPQITGVPSRLASDLSRAATANRIGKRQVVLQGNDFDPAINLPIASVANTGTANPVFNVSGSFAARTRDHMPFQDVTLNLIPGQTLSFASVSGTFATGETIQGTSGSTAIVQSVAALTITIYSISGYGFNNGEVVKGLTSAASATIVTSTGGVRVPTVLGTTGSDVITLTLTGVGGSFAIGDVVTGGTSGAQGIVRATTATTLDLTELYGFFQIGETLTGPSPGNGTISAIDTRTGAVTSATDSVRNIVNVIDTKSGRKPVDASGNLFYGRLLFGPNGASGAGGGAPGELLVGTAGNQEINFTQNSTIITNNNIDFTQFFLPGDLIEGADGRFYEISPTAGSVTSSQLTLTTGKGYQGKNASAGAGAPNTGFNVPVARRRRRYLLELVVLSGGTETSATLTVGTNIPTGASIRPFFPCWLTELQSNFDADFVKNAPGDGTVTATQTIPGVGIVATSGSSPPAPPTPVFGTLQNFQNNGAPLGPGNFHTINFAAGGATAANGVVTIPAISGPSGLTGPTGPAGPGFSGQGPYANTGLIGGPIGGPGTGASGPSTFGPFGGTVRFYMVCISYVSAGGGSPADSFSIDSVTPGSPSAAQLEVGWTLLAPGSADLNVKIGASAAF